MLLAGVALLLPLFFGAEIAVVTVPAYLLLIVPYLAGWQQLYRGRRWAVSLIRVMTVVYVVIPLIGGLLCLVAGEFLAGLLFFLGSCLVVGLSVHPLILLRRWRRVRGQGVPPFIPLAGGSSLPERLATCFGTDRFVPQILLACTGLLLVLVPCTTWASLQGGVTGVGGSSVGGTPAMRRLFAHEYDPPLWPGFVSLVLGLAAAGLALPWLRGYRRAAAILTGVVAGMTVCEQLMVILRWKPSVTHAQLVEQFILPVPRVMVGLGVALMLRGALLAVLVGMLMPSEPRDGTPPKTSSPP
jgi:hypothetical protein